MNRLALVLVLAACGPAAFPTPSVEPRLHNGKGGKLRFDVDFQEPDAMTRIATGASLSIGVPRIPRQGKTSGAERWKEGATFVVTVGPGLDLGVSSTLDQVRAEVRCLQPGAWELAVLASNPDGTSLADAIDVGCIDVTRVSAEVGNAKDRPLAYLVGSTLWVSVAAHGVGPGGVEVALTGNAPVAVAPGSEALLSAVDEPSAFSPVRSLKAEKVGVAPEVTWLGKRAALPITIVDVPDWIPGMTVTRVVNPANPTNVSQQYLHARLSVKAPDGTPLYGLGNCTFHSVHGKETKPQGMSASCEFYAPSDASAFGADQLCLTVEGREACAAVPK